MATDDVIETDAVIIGAGPVGLFQAFQLGLLEIQSHIIDALPHPGGQPAELYPNKPIYDIPAVPVCTGQELTDALLLQVRPFTPTFHLGQTVSRVERQDDDRFLVSTSQHLSLLTKTVFIAAGVGAFEPRRLKLDGLDEFEGSQLFFGPRGPEQEVGRRVLVVGDTDSALRWALTLVKQGGVDVTLMHRRDVFQSDTDLQTQMRTLFAAGRMRLLIGQATACETDGGLLNAISILRADGATERLSTDSIYVLQGLSPRLGVMTQWGLAMERKQLVVDTATFSTSEPGIFAVGDINTYPGKKKLIVCGFHECVLAAYAAASWVFPGKSIHLEYTTSSSRLHRLLEVQPSPPDGPSS
jgi:thioredoxin reductase (NADPH)